MITLTKLTDRQTVFCDILWQLQDRDQVDRFIAALPQAEAQECRTLVELMVAELFDSVDSVDEAQNLLDKFSK